MSDKYSDEVIENLRFHYYTSIIMLQNEDDILKELPDPWHESFFSIVDGLIELLNKDIIVYQEDFGDEALDEIKLLKYKIELCEKRKSEALSLVKEETEVLQSDKVKNLIFATTSSGNIYFEHDIKDMPEEFYDRIILALECLSGRKEFDSLGKIGGFSADNTLAGIQKFILYQVRLDFRILSDDSYYILGVRKKKDDNSRLDKRKPAERKSKTEEEFRYLKQLLKDPIEKEKIVSYNNEIREKLLSYLEENKRGGRKNGK